MTEEQKKKEFAAIAVSLREELKDWYKEQVELEQAMTGTSPGSSNVWNVSTRMKSIQVIQSMVIVEGKLGFEIPEDKMPALVKEGGYASFEEMVDDLFPKLEKVYVAGGFEEKKEKEKAEAE